jgi:hypothetical protein
VLPLGGSRVPYAAQAEASSHKKPQECVVL